MAILRRVVLRDFRNYENLDLCVAPGINLLIGENGQGKTNFLEAIYFLSILRSFRSHQLKNFLRWRQKSFVIRAEVDSGPGTKIVALEYGVKRRLRIDGQKIDRASDFIGQIYSIAFVPEDIELVKGPASERRRFLDITLTQSCPGYLATLQEYDKALKSRNRLLRRASPDLGEIHAFDAILINRGAGLIRSRVDFFRQFKTYLAAAATQMLPEEQQLTVRYRASTPLNDAETEDYEAILRQALEQSWDRDLSYGLTHSGPHRDDFGLYLDDKDLSNFGSEGQCRLAALSLKLAKAEYLLEQKAEETIILLVDDVIGELDERSRRAFLASLEHAKQVFLACTSAADVGSLQPAATFAVKAGTIEPLASES